MAQQPPNYEGPPPYSAQDQDCADELVDPTILILVGSSVYAEAATSPPLYNLSHSIDSLTGSESLVVLERYINTVRTGADEVPRIACRKRHIYDLKHLPPVLSPNFAFVLGAVSRRWCIGNIGFRKSARPGQGFKAVTTRPVKSDRFPKGYQARQPSEKEIDQIFGVKIRQNTYEWHTLDGGLVAVEDGRDDQLRLIITAPLTRRIMDALVGCWCLRIWYNNIEIQKGSQQRSKMRTNVRVQREVLPRFW